MADTFCGPVFGWLPNPAAVARVVASMARPYFAGTPANTPGAIPAEVFLWDAERKVMGSILPPYNQLDGGTCVGFGTNRAVKTLTCVQIALGEPIVYKELAEEATYGGSRVEVGRNAIPAGSDGSVGAWAAKFVTEWGMVARGQYDGLDLTTYSVSTARKLGSGQGLSAAMEAVAKEHPVGAFAQVKTWSEAKNALASGYPIAICSNVGFEGMTRDSQGFIKRSGTWNHCMALLGYQTGSREGGFICNSWGGNAHGGPIGAGDHTAAGFWADAATVDAMLGQDDSWAFSKFAGFPARQLNWVL